MSSIFSHQPASLVCNEKSVGQQVWDVIQLYFYADDCCSLDRTGDPISSGFFSSDIQPDSFAPFRAFDTNALTIWGGRRDSDGLWIGLDFGAPTDIRCVRLQESTANFTLKVIIEARLDSSSPWLPVNSMTPADTTDQDSIFPLYATAVEADEFLV